MEVNLVVEALKFMMLGMGVVFAFLIIMIYALKAQAVLINKFFPVKEKQPPKKVQPQTHASDETAKKVAAIAAVIQHHNNLKG
ncbi:OadG family protein [Candidatus Marinarcus aquaticus]|uniref:Probable oxaloacetate decarboxylase gamma chain n=1 Tax=Candidatus Marinarcus aquaticus TaxID=2044504 RepID=A0A4Q0XTB6_9BACT|nr:OadG family transporter subunit [Candidatus Marinarcus aquaticus]RXJ60095.1 sodium pump decarboxylase subunit gamma [Candidatus Marinarcus aquaticus]